jgi:alpha-L-fucosidase
MLIFAATFVVTQETLAEPSVKETREGGTSIIRITAKDGAEKVYRIDLSQHHAPATVKNDLLKKWEAYRFGAFVCYNTNQFSGDEVCHATDPKLYSPQHLDVAGWVKAFKDAGMKYAVLTTVHTSGFLLWNSATTEFDVASSGNTTDVCREIAQECRRQGLVPAFYYNLWCSKQRKPRCDARAVVLAQLYELATQFGEIPNLRVYGEKAIRQWQDRNRCPENDKLCEEAVWFTQTMFLGPRSDMDQIAEAVRKIHAYAPQLAARK